ncbi:MAG: 3-isopropylmalate dehydratase small subunit [Symplocastrum torsivum CPER-KK1]|jgi:3-isopropylmalate/(R)-2-methylmalate dehydratase small subunit|uniref:3-isopropylmalate dehydratase small subunit n=1 Tax=Symplocastrum torsivum CPER-KK1 TaxID=450513 RepID=A0A951PRQ7_9CYAN|nr:3-isopropylmalate dehydratase small subunit [Symplocastrum torsivum CPER-KK1]
MSSEVKVIEGRGIPLVGNDIDTDRIIPARFLRCVTFDGLGEQAFADDRVQAKGEHPFDQPQYQGANILVVNGNFGCGSSREHAPQALAKWGIQAVVGESFAEIFFGNCVAIGIPGVTAEPTTVKQLQTILQENPQASITVDLDAMQVHCGDFQASVSMGEGSRQMLTTGTWDTCVQLLAQIDPIRATVAKLPYVDWDSRVVATSL